MALSAIADRYLSSLERRHSPSPDRLASKLRELGVESPEPWLEFESQFGGYVEPIGLDVAIWGLLQDDTEWLPSAGIELDLEEGLVACADVHPSYDYWLDRSGEFLGLGGGGPCDSFAVKVEQTAVLWVFSQNPGDVRLTGEPNGPPKSMHRYSMNSRIGLSDQRRILSKTFTLMSASVSSKIVNPAGREFGSVSRAGSLLS